MPATVSRPKKAIESVENGFFSTERRRKNLSSMKIRELVGTASDASEAEKHGTVGAVACDANGHLAAATSTGGYTNKPVGRVGDSPIIGAGTYARDGAAPSPAPARASSSSAIASATRSRR